MQHGTTCQCTECRKAFVPNASARKTQKTCGRKACRDERRWRHARRRRRSDLAAYRADERERQQRRRARLKEEREGAGAGETPDKAAREAPVAVAEAPGHALAGCDRAVSGHVPGSCHAPAFTHKDADYQAKLVNCLAAVLELSRAGLGQDLPRFLRKIARSGCSAARSVNRVSRATLGADVAENTGKSGRKSAPLSRTGLSVTGRGVLSVRAP
jgi:hypothetical protein